MAPAQKKKRPNDAHANGKETPVKRAKLAKAGKAGTKKVPRAQKVNRCAVCCFLLSWQLKVVIPLSRDHL
jgi:hypothetical protein